MARLPNVRLDLPNRPENVVLVRETLTGIAEAVNLDGSDLSDVRTAVTEACNNVVLHAYPGEEGPLEVDVEVGSGSVEVVVRDQGIGIPSGDDGEGEIDLGIGIPVIRALTRTADFARPGSGGTEVRMEFDTPAVRGVAPSEDGAALPEVDQEDRPAIFLSIAPANIARSVVPRLLCVLAARAHFSTDRISDSQLLADALVAHAGGALAGGHLRLAIAVEPRDIELQVGPLISGRAQELLEDSDLDGLGPVLGKLADRHEITSVDSHDVLTLQLLDRH